MTRSTTARGALVVSLLGLTGGMLTVGGPAQAQAAGPQSTWVAVASGDLGPATAAATRAGATVTRTLPGIGQLVLRADAAEAAALRASGTVRSVTPDAQVQLAAATYDPASDPGSTYSLTTTTGARSAWNAGWSGSGVDIALIDSGVTPVAGAPRLVAGPDLSFDSQDSGSNRIDKYGHGTHLASIMAGEDSLNARTTPTAETGIAPDARVVSVKVGDVNGGVDVSQVIAAIDWVVQNKSNTLNIRVINLSFGTSSTQAWNLDPVAYAAETAVRKGIVVIAAAGNTGGVGLDDPAYDPNVIAVGASDPRGTVDPSDDVVASFSTRGNGTRNPDLVAPGVGIVGLRVPGSTIDQEVPSSTGSRFIRGTGTSQAAAVVSGAAALLLQEHPSMTPAQVKAVLQASATPLSGMTAAAQGAGELNIAKAIAAAVPSSVPASSAGTGTGTLDAARGDQVLLLDGSPLSGEKDIWGKAVSTSALASAENGGTAWSGGTFNGSTWSSSGWGSSAPVQGAEMTWANPSIGSQTLWSGLALSSWSGRSWSGRSWSGRSWSGRSWSGRYWSDKLWQNPEGTAPTAASATTTTACSALPAWSSATAYNGGQSVTYGGKKWTARYWTQGNTPGDSTGVWGTSASC